MPWLSFRKGASPWSSGEFVEVSDPGGVQVVSSGDLATFTTTRVFHRQLSRQSDVPVKPWVMR